MLTGLLQVKNDTFCHSWTPKNVMRTRLACVFRFESRSKALKLEMSVSRRGFGFKQRAVSLIEHTRLEKAAARRGLSG